MFGCNHEEIEKYLEKYSPEIVTLFRELKKIIYSSIKCEVEEKFWTKLPSYYVNENFVRLISFNDHINVEASDLIKHKSKLNGYKMTP